jgi:hypothetical protein
MKITVQIMVQSDEAEAQVVQQVVRLERGPLKPETLGLSLAEARSIRPAWSRPWRSSRRQNLSPSSVAVPGAAVRARAKATTRSCFAPPLAN